jgi:hypothetical protein
VIRGLQQRLADSRRPKLQTVAVLLTILGDSARHTTLTTGIALGMMLQLKTPPQNRLSLPSLAHLKFAAALYPICVR